VTNYVKEGLLAVAFSWTKTGQKWVTQIALGGVFNNVKEF